MARIYEYRCPVCRAELEAYNAIEERRTHAPYHCGVQTEIEIRTAPKGYVDNMEEYICPVTRQGVTTRRQRNEIMKREGLIDANDFLKTDEQRRAVQAKYDADQQKYKDYGPDVVRKTVTEWVQTGQV
jgi:Zn-finger nucleic acid-binding protein